MINEQLTATLLHVQLMEFYGTFIYWSLFYLCARLQLGVGKALITYLYKTLFVSGFEAKRPTPAIRVK